jgi:competence protein ComEC
MAEQKKSSLPSPLLLPTLGWCAGIYLATALHLSLLWLIVTVVIGIGLSFLFRFKLPMVLLLFVLAGFLRMTIAIEKPPTILQKVLSEKGSLTQPCSGVVIRVLTPTHDYYLVRLTSINNKPVNDKALLSCDAKMLPADRFEALAQITLKQSDPVLDNASFYWSVQSRQTPIIIKRIYNLKQSSPKAILNLERIRYILLASMEKKMGQAAPFARALLLNDRTEDKQWIQQLVQGGLLHLIAISGLHVLFFYLIFITLMNIVLPRRTAEIIFLVLMLIYAGLCQWSAPVMRAILMLLLFMIAKWMQRPVAPMQLICLSLLIITIVAPVQLFSIGLQLSYLCVITLLYAVPRRLPIPNGIPLGKRRYLSIRNAVIETILVSTIVSFVMLPIMLFYFYRGTLNGIVGNLLGIPLVGFLLPLSFALMLMPGDWLLFHWLKSSFDALHYVFAKWVVWTARLPLYLDTVVLPLSLLIALYLIIAAISIRIKHGTRLRRWSYALLIIAIPFFIFAQIPKHKPFTMTVFNAGLGDCTLIEFPHGQTLMIDTGPPSFTKDSSRKRSWFGSKTNLWQKTHKINKIDLLILTHLHSDHIGGLEDVYRNMQVRNLLVTDFSTQTQEWKALQKAGFLQESQIKIISDTLSFIFADSQLTILHPSKDYTGTSENDNSIVLRLDYKDFSALLTGDITSDVEMLLMKDIPDKLDTDFLKVAHHGSKYSSSLPFIRAVSPQQAVIPTSLHNRFRFPDNETMVRFRQYGLEPQLTGNGSVIVTVP